MKQNILSNSIKIKTKEKEFLKSIFLVLSGVIFLSIMSQLIIPLYFTPVPISLGSFGVMLIALLYGRKLGTATVLSYVAAALILGFLSDKGIAKSYVKTFLSLLLVSVIIFVLGALVLMLFVPIKNVFMVGVLPFIPGDMLKAVAATLLFPRLWKFIKKNKN